MHQCEKKPNTTFVTQKELFARDSVAAFKETYLAPLFRLLGYGVTADPILASLLTFSKIGMDLQSFHARFGDDALDDFMKKVNNFSSGLVCCWCVGLQVVILHCNCRQTRTSVATYGARHCQPSGMLVHGHTLALSRLTRR